LSNKTGIDWIDFGLDELKLEHFVQLCFQHFIQNNSSLFQSLISDQILTTQSFNNNNNNNCHFKVKGFVLREQAQAQTQKEENDDNNWKHSFVYKAKGIGLNDNGTVTGIHMDGSDITFDLCLGESFDGGCLCFYSNENGNENPSSLPPPPKCQFKYEHKVGNMTIFSGHNLHSVQPIQNGSRVNLVAFITFL